MSEGVLLMELAPKRTRKKGSPITFRPTEDVDELLSVALDATGADQTELILQCIREELPSVVQKILEKQKTKAARFDALLKKKTGTGQ